MARIDVPTLQCDRCKWTTQDQQEMSKFNTITGQWDGYQSSKEKWDLCESCWKSLVEEFLGNHPVKALVRLTNG
ncbi:hypothetical protein HWB51_gp092 [Mycobacterium phage Cuke]|uniref:Uncharacterized protein n=1 Tax=Mycobacterium phage Cuke TaxID=2079417 RepID=A0A2L1IWY2_9CAUD|nr:hypothetical protein HWB51_gp092 [Mycobacterium phage Cuke]AVD99720.1 hypothetical protein SEA_CUKE_104 [Mycobacterium phage Cuke]